MTWEPIETAPKDRQRILLCWKAFGGVKAHIELGYWSDAKKAWCNTYGHEFSGDADYWFPPPPASH